ncbi:MAG: type II toxin-antitoxin system prevent-host-death family antitoxin [Cellulomonadaceae bacterium]|jgi:prevent-host-death family protein|nr:type II toxin-antitoxin system prevent-host-death family antitoxin [Cellulomonadaceae bacterium]
MSMMTATAASRGFSKLLDAVMHGDTVTITRGNEPIAEVRPVPQHTFAGLRALLADSPGFDDSYASDISSAAALLTENADPWAANS